MRLKNSQRRFQPEIDVLLIPFKLKNPKTRLSKLLNQEQRKKFALSMLEDVLTAVKSVRDLTSRMIIAVPDDETADVCRNEVCKKYRSLELEIHVDSRDLSSLVNSFLSSNSVAVVMSDVPLLTENILRVFLNTKGDVVISPGRKGGTNLLLVRNPLFRCSYHYGSFLKHITIAKDQGLDITIFDSYFAGIDIDDENDVLELLIHGRGRKSYDFLIDQGFKLDCSKKDPCIIRV
jgi:2-phospho-L-lactate guanylyltransferase